MALLSDLGAGVASQNAVQLKSAATLPRYGGVNLGETSALRADRMPDGGRGLSERDREGLPTASTNLPS